MTTRVGDYLLLEVIGTGSVGTVRHAIREKTGEHYAIKIMEKAQIVNEELTVNVRREIRIMQAFNHINIVYLHKVLASKSHIYLVLELVRGYELFDVIKRAGSKGLPETQARTFFHQLIDGVEYCHKNGVCHRDLKLENILINHNGCLKITDFGLGSIKPNNGDGGLLTTPCGTLYYVAPEVIHQKPEYCGKKVDAWACGIILFSLVAGYLPFNDSEGNVDDLIEKIQAGHVNFPSWISPGVRDLISHLLCGAEHRFSLQQVKKHAWFTVDYERRKPVHRHSVDVNSARVRSKHRTYQKNIPPRIPSLCISSIRPIPSHPPSSTTFLADAGKSTFHEDHLSEGGKFDTRRAGRFAKGDIGFGDSKLKDQAPSLALEAHEGSHEEMKMCLVSLNNPNLDFPPAITNSTVDFLAVGDSDISDVEKFSIASKSTHDIASYEKKTIQAIRSLQALIAQRKNRSTRGNTTALLGDNGQSDAIMGNLRAIRFHIELSGDDHPKDMANRHSKGFGYSHLSVVQRQHALSLLDVLEGTIVNIPPPKRSGCNNAAITEEELSGFQTLLHIMETQLVGEMEVEELIPGRRLGVEEDDFPSPQGKPFLRRSLESLNNPYNHYYGSGNAGQKGFPCSIDSPKKLALPSSRGSKFPRTQRSTELLASTPGIIDKSTKMDDLTENWNNILSSEAPVPNDSHHSDCEFQRIESPVEASENTNVQLGSESYEMPKSSETEEASPKEDFLGGSLHIVVTSKEWEPVPVVNASEIFGEGAALMQRDVSEGDGHDQLPHVEAQLSPFPKRKVSTRNNAFFGDSSSPKLPSIQPIKKGMDAEMLREVERTKRGRKEVRRRSSYVENEEKERNRNELSVQWQADKFGGKNYMRIKGRETSKISPSLLQRSAHIDRISCEIPAEAEKPEVIKTFSFSSFVGELPKLNTRGSSLYNVEEGSYLNSDVGSIPMEDVECGKKTEKKAESIKSTSVEDERHSENDPCSSASMKEIKETTFSKLVAHFGNAKEHENGVHHRQYVNEIYKQRRSLEMPPKILREKTDASMNKGKDIRVVRDALPGCVRRGVSYRRTGTQSVDNERKPEQGQEHRKKKPIRNFLQVRHQSLLTESRRKYEVDDQGMEARRIEDMQAHNKRPGMLLRKLRGSRMRSNLEKSEAVFPNELSRFPYLLRHKKFHKSFESAYDTEECKRKLSTLLTKNGLVVAFGQREYVMQVPFRNDEFREPPLWCSFEFVRGNSGSVVHFRKLSGDRRISKHDEEWEFNHFYEEVLEEFKRQEPGIAVL